MSIGHRYVRHPASTKSRGVDQEPTIPIIGNISKAPQTITSHATDITDVDRTASWCLMAWAALIYLLRTGRCDSRCRCRCRCQYQCQCRDDLDPTCHPQPGVPQLILTTIPTSTCSRQDGALKLSIMTGDTRIPFKTKTWTTGTKMNMRIKVIIQTKK